MAVVDSPRQPCRIYRIFCNQSRITKIGGKPKRVCPFHGGKKVAGKVYYNPNSLTKYIAVFTPAEPLMPNTEYTAELTTGIMGNLKQHLAKPYIWKFTTGG